MLKCVIIPVTYYQQNCALVWCERTQVGGGDRPRRGFAAHRTGQHHVSLKQVLLTHGHFDHAGQAKKLAEARTVPILGPHKDDAFWVE